MRDKKPEPKKGASKIDALRAEREKRAAEMEKQARCPHSKVVPGPGARTACPDCGAVVGWL